MSLFRRRRDKSDEPVEQIEAVDEDALDDEADEGRADAGEAADEDAARDDEAQDDDARDGDDATDEDDDRGPYDIDEAPDDDLPRLDLGSLKIYAPPGVEVQVQTNEQGEVAAVAMISGANAVQVGAFAAPRTEGIWDEVRAELRESVESEGGSVTESAGVYGPELIGRMTTPQGRQAVRFVGIDGPRWFVRALFHGAVATDPDAAPQLAECLSKLVVERGTEAMPVREPLPLHLPPESIERAAGEPESGPDGAGR